MLDISFKRHSLLYGESCLFAVISYFTPFFWWPDPAKTRTKQVLGMSATRRHYFILVARLQRSLILRLFFVGSEMLFQIGFALMLITFGIIVQKDFVFFLNKLNEGELAYKVIYYSPIVYRMGLFLMIMIALASRLEYREWTTLDHFKIFSVDRASQLRLILSSALTIVPDLICCWLDMMMLLSFLRSERYGFLRSTLTPASLNLAFLCVASLTSVINTIIRYKPFITLLYCGLCVRQHMSLIKRQLYLSHQTQPEGRPSAAETQTGARRRPSLGQRAAWAIEKPNKLARVGRMDAWLSGAKWCLASGKSAGASERAETELVETGSAQDDEAITRMFAATCRAEDPQCEIKSLFELERHLTLLHLFTASLDRCSPGSIYALCLFNSIATFYAFLFVREIPPEELNPFYVIVFCSARLVPTLRLLLVGHAIELECREILNLIESIYLQSDSHSMLYRQLKDSQHSLARIFRLLTWIKFTGDGLIPINMETLKRLVFYLMSALFIVIQYDSLLVIEELGGAERPNDTSATLNDDYRPMVKFS